MEEKSLSNIGRFQMEQLCGFDSMARREYLSADFIRQDLLPPLRADKRRRETLVRLPERGH
jgi:hypothetical protein